MHTKTINIARDFSRYPAGRFPSDGPFNGQLFRENFLKPALHENDVIAVELDGTRGYGSSFLEEAFGGLVRARLISHDWVKKIKLISNDDSKINEIQGYISDALNKK